jgi:hypothetical protein
VAEWLSPQEAARRLGRSEGGILSAIARGRLERGQLNKNWNPFHCPATGIWIGKTCPDCGKFRGADSFGMNTGGKSGKRAIYTRCRFCVTRLDQKGRAKLHQAMTLAQAHKKGDRYTDSDIEVVMDRTKSTVQVALELGRTYAAISALRSKLRFNPIDRSRRKKLHWVINFPAAQKVLEDHFAALGRAVPESEWEWNDSVPA